MDNYVPLHVHTDFSLMDGIAKPEEYVLRAKELDMPAFAVTDHGSLPAHRPVYKACKENGIKPILGIEAYFTGNRLDRRDRKERSEPLDSIYNHLIILAKNANGLQNLNKLNELAWTEGYFYKPRMDFDILDQYGDDLIVSSACMGGLINQAIEQGEYATAKQHLGWFKQRFGDDFYIEMMPHNIPGMNDELYQFAKDMDIKAIVTPDCHHCTPDQKVIQELMLILNTYPGKRKENFSYQASKAYDNMMDRLNYLYPDRKLTFTEMDIHLLSYDEMHKAMDKHGDYDDSIYTNTLEIADKVEDYKLKSNLNLLPAKHKNPAEELRHLTIAGLKNRGLFDDPTYVDRAMDELRIIADKKFDSYFLIIADIISWAKDQGILVGPGRGSAAGSLVCYALGITEIDPIKHNLLFFRFIDPSRPDWPDIDIDFQDTRREEVKAYIEKKYKYVANIATYSTFGGKKEGEDGGKMIVKDISRAIGVPLADVNKVAKQIETWDEYCEGSNAKWYRDKYPEVQKYGNQLLGRIRQTGIHAAGLITSKEPIWKYAPLEMRDKDINGTKERVPVAAIDMEEAADIGFIKIDLLGLKTLNVIDETIKAIKARHKIDIDLLSLPTNDPEIYTMISAGNTKGVFQCEQTPYTRLILEMGIHNFDDLAVSNALVRPGAKNTIGAEFIARKHGKSPVTYVHPIMEDILSDTLGTIIYQEQVMLACTELGGMSMEEASKVRKIIGKKRDAKEFDQYKDRFVEGASQHIAKSAAEKLWHSFEAHADYSFNKSHSVAYSTISYWTAWLKFYYPLEFMWALLKNEQDADKRTEYLIEAKRMGITIKLPHVNESDVDFKIEGKAIRFGLSSVKYVAHNGAKNIIDKRPFESFKQFKDVAEAKFSGINARATTSLDSIGALTFPDNPRNPERVKENLYEALKLPEFNFNMPRHFYDHIDELADFDETSVNINLGIVTKIKRGKGWSRVEFLDKSGTCGIFDKQETQLEKGRTYLVLSAKNSIMEALTVDEFENITGLTKFLNYKTMPCGPDEVYVVAFVPRITKAGKKMATAVVADQDRNLYPILVFPQAFSMAYIRMEPGTVVRILTEEKDDGTIVLQNVAKGNAQ